MRKKPVSLALPRGSSIGRDGQASNARLVNAYSEENGRDGKSTYSIYASPGLKRWDNIGANGACRGLLAVSDSELYAVLGNEIYVFDQGGNGTLRGSIPGSGPVYMSFNRASPAQIAILTGSKQLYVMTTGGATLVTDGDLIPPNSIGYLDGFLLAGEDGGNIQSSALEDVASWFADGRGIARSEASSLKRVFPSGGYLYAFKEKATELWQADASLAASNFTFAPAGHSFPIGLGAPHSVCEAKGGIIWVDNELIIRYGRDRNAVRISGHSVERAIADLTSVELEGVTAFVHSFHGHEFYRIKSDKWTWECDLLNGFVWQERSSFGRGTSKVQHHQYFNGLDIVGTDENGKLWILDIDTYSEGSDPLIMEVHCGHVHNFPEYFFGVHSLSIDAIAGVGLNGGVDRDDDPQMMVSYSEDGGRTFTGERHLPIGRIGETHRVLKSLRWGKIPPSGRIWRFSVAASVLKGINQAYLVGR